MYAVGLMSGTSLDGIDAVLCEIEGFESSTKINQLAFSTTPYAKELKEDLHRCCANEQSTTALICSVNFALGDVFADAILSLCKQYGISSDQLDFIASHGQTIYHRPKPTTSFCASTLQIGEPALIANRCHTKVVSDFRVKLLQRYALAQSEDIIHTLTWFTAYSIAEHYRKYLLPKRSIHEVILAKGGTHNQTLRFLLQKELSLPIFMQEDKGFSLDAKEAIAFVILGNITPCPLPKELTL